MMTQKSPTLGNFFSLWVCAENSQAATKNDARATEAAMTSGFNPHYGHAPPKSSTNSKKSIQQHLFKIFKSKTRCRLN
jgi:hypothetical protein